MKKLTLYLLTVIAVITFVISPIATVVAYELIFDKRYETEAWREFSVADFEGLEVERSDFESAGTSLSGYKYKKNTQEIKGVLVIAHGMGGGGHNSFMPFIDYFTSNGYYVFTYDAQGNDNSEGTLEGLPTGVISK